MRKILGRLFFVGLYVAFFYGTSYGSYYREPEAIVEIGEGIFAQSVAAEKINASPAIKQRVLSLYRGFHVASQNKGTVEFVEDPCVHLFVDVDDGQKQGVRMIHVVNESECDAFVEAH